MLAPKSNRRSAWVPAWSRERPIGHSRRRDDDSAVYRDRTYPRASPLCHHTSAAALTGRLDPTPDVAAAGAWKDARWGRIQEALAPDRRSGAAVMSCVARSRVAISVPRRSCPCGTAGEWRKPKRGPGQNRRTRVPKGNPRTVRSRGPKRSSRRPARVSWGRKAPRLSSRHPRPVFRADIAAARQDEGACASGWPATRVCWKQPPA